MIHLVVGPAGHGVVLHGQQLAHAGAGGFLHLTEPPTTTPSGLSGAVVLAQFTDKVFGRTPELAAEAFERLVAPAARVTVVLHDLPQASDGRHRAARAAAYRRVRVAAGAAIVSSHHERLLLRSVARPLGLVSAEELDRRTHVVPLPVRTPGSLPGPPAPSTDLPTVATLGYLYPGKGVEQVIEAVARLDPKPQVVNLGRASEGHADLVPSMQRMAADHGLTWSTTGWLDEHELGRRLREVTVPVAAHRHVSASGSINTWIGAGRRPIVVRSRYAEELADRLPGAVRLVGPGVADLADAVAEALAGPSATWCPPGLRLGPTWAQAARMAGRVATGRVAAGTATGRAASPAAASR